MLLGIVAAQRAFSFPADPKGFARIEEGMSKPEVIKRMGEPTRNTHGIEWTYSKFLVFGFVTVGFDDGETVSYTNFERF